MTETDHSRSGAHDPNVDDSPFATPPIEGMPFERGSEEDAAIQRVLEKSKPHADDA